MVLKPKPLPRYVSVCNNKLFQHFAGLRLDKALPSDNGYREIDAAQDRWALPIETDRITKAASREELAGFRRRGSSILDNQNEVFNPDQVHTPNELGLGYRENHTKSMSI